MAHFAELDESNTVLRVIVIEHAELVRGLWGDPERWVQCSYNTKGGVHFTNGQASEDQSKALRKNFPLLGAKYDPDRDAFINPSLYPSWVLNETSCLWEPHIPKPEDQTDSYYLWDEETVSWVKNKKIANKSPQTLPITTL